MAGATAGIFAPRKAAGEPNMLLAEAGTGIGKTLGLSRAGVAVGRARRRDGVGVDLHQGAAAATGCRKRADRRRPRGAQEAHRHPQGARELSVPAQPRGRDAGRVRGARGGAGATGRAVGGLFEGRRHGRGRPARLAAEPVPARGGGGADRSPRRVRLCRLPALPQMLHRARRAGGARGRYRHRQPRAGHGQCRARTARCADADRVRRGASSVRRRRFDLFGGADGAGSDRDAALDRRARGQGARAAAGSCGAVDGRVLVRRSGGRGARRGGRGGARAADRRLAPAHRRRRPVRPARALARAGARHGLCAVEGAGSGLWTRDRAGRARWRAGQRRRGGDGGARSAGATAGGADAAARSDPRGCARLARQPGAGASRGRDQRADVAARDARRVDRPARAGRRRGRSGLRRLADDRARRGARI